MVSFQCAAVPAVVPELVLALPNPLLGSLANGLHQVWVSLAQLSLLVDQAWNVVAYDPCTQCTDVPAEQSSHKHKVLMTALQKLLQPMFHLHGGILI